MKLSAPPDTSNPLQTALDFQQRGDVDSARQIYQQILASGPDANALHLLGLIEHQQGNCQRALQLIEQAAQLEPTSGVIQNNRGNVYRSLGHADWAEECFRQACRLEPQLTTAWLSLGRSILDQNRPGEAAGIFQRLREIDPRSAIAHHQLGIAWQRLNQPDEAEAAYREAIRLQPDLADAYNDLGSLLRSRQRNSAAAEAFALATQHRPDFAAAWSNLGVTLAGLSQHVAAEQALRRAIQLRPGYAGAHYNLANLLKDHGQTELAVTHYLTAVEKQPRNVDFLMNLVAALNCLGRFDEAIQYVRQVIEIDPAHAQAYYVLLTFNPESVTEQEVTRLEQLLANAELTVSEKAGAYFSLGKRYERLEQYDRAFANFARGNELIAATREFDAPQLIRFVDRSRAFLTREFFARTPLCGSASRQPIFILGMPRSGSTLVDQILTSHSQVGGAGEFTGIRTILQRFLDQPYRARLNSPDENPYPESLGLITQAEFDAMASVYLQKLAELGGNSARITDKMPTNAFHLGLISVLFPNATVIYTRRNPLDVCLSCYFQNFTNANGFSFHLKHTAQFYREHVRLMEHWFEVCPLRIHTVDYETLVDHQERESHRLIEEICGLPWEPGCLQFEKNRRAVTTASLWQVRQPIYRDSVGKWKHYARHLEPLFEELGEVDQSAA